ncbi:MAG: putative manganese-dependent inorganic diphosphatase [Pirellulales bacterium]|nr:putative manganese-dependent inorganic diphosphatase [Pirellulales bacterium]
MPVYVIGHRNPDTDAICAAIGYAEYLRETHLPDAVAACCGTLNPRTKFALERAGVPEPQLLMDVRPTVGQVCRQDVISARPSEALLQIYQRMQKHRIRTIPVVNDDRALVGMVNLLDLLSLLIPDSEEPTETRHVHTNLRLLERVLGGTFQHCESPDRDEQLTVVVGAMSAGGFERRLEKYAPESALIVSGNRPTIQVPAIEYGVRCVVVTGGYELSEGLLQMAKDRGVSVLQSPHDTATTTLLIRGAQLVEPVIQKRFRKFSSLDALSKVRDEVARLQQDLFPVVHDDDELVGVFSKPDLMGRGNVQIVLVDHNEIAQAVQGADEVEILEVIDHHRLGGGLISREPIRFHNEPVGSTSTIVARMFRDHRIALSREIGTCLAAGIISDTLYLKSPTTTSVDESILAWLEDVTELDLRQFAEDFFSAGSVLQQHSTDEAVRMDCKEYSEGPWSFAVAQVEESGLTHFESHRDDLQQTIEQLAVRGGYAFVCLMVTDVNRQESLLMVAGSDELKQALGYPRLESNVFDLSNIVSRKKQLLPHIIHTLGALRMQPESLPRG